MRFNNAAIQIFILVFLTSCAYQTSKISCEDSLPLLAKNTSNTLLQVDVPAQLNDFKIGNPLFITAKNTSNFRIQIAPDNGLKLFLLQDNSWVVVKNKADYLEVIESISVKSVSDPGLRTYYAEPDVPNQSETIQICIVLQGLMDTNDSKSKVIAFTEVTLNP